MPLRHILLASFIISDKVEWYYGYMEGKHDIKRRDIFKYRQIEDPDTFIFTFRYIIDTNENLNFGRMFPNAMLIHKKGDALYTINGLNKLIDQENADGIGNLNHSDIKIDWSQYQNRMILANGENLSINEVERIF